MNMLRRTNVLISANRTFARELHLLSQKAYVNNEWIGAASKKVLDVVNPVNGEVITSVPDMDVEDAQKAIDHAANAFKTWQFTTAKERSQLLRNWYNLLVENRNEIAEIMSAEAGKPMKEALGEVAYGNSFVEWFSEQARNVRGEIIPSPIPSKKILVEKQPIGVVGLITPWNFPHAMITRKASAALSVGCTVVIRPAEDTPLTALAMMKLAEQAGFPNGVLNVITSCRQNSATIGKLFCESDKIAGISFTGSTEVGKILYRQCANGLKRLALELGGNAPFIVFKSANIDKAVEGAIVSKFRNAGQTCVSSNRFLVEEEVFQPFVDGIVEKVKQMKMGCNLHEDVNVGPLINEAQFQKVSALVEDAVCKGATVLTGGKARENLGKLFYEPTVLVGIKENMRVYQEEVFGPVLSIICCKNEEHCLNIANSTNRGLAGYFYSEDISQIFRVNRKLEVGMLGINEGLISTCEAPFGGIKESGLGREGSHHGVDDFTYIKYTCIGGLE